MSNENNLKYSIDELCEKDAINEIKNEAAAAVSLARILRRVLEDGEVAKSDMWALSDILVEKTEEITCRLSKIDSDF